MTALALRQNPHRPGPPLNHRPNSHRPSPPATSQHFAHRPWDRSPLASSQAADAADAGEPPVIARGSAGAMPSRTDAPRGAAAAGPSRGQAPNRSFSARTDTSADDDEASRAQRPSSAPGNKQNGDGAVAAGNSESEQERGGRAAPAKPLLLRSKSEHGLRHDEANTDTATEEEEHHEWGARHGFEDHYQSEDIISHLANVRRPISCCFPSPRPPTTRCCRVAARTPSDCRGVHLGTAWPERREDGSAKVPCLFRRPDRPVSHVPDAASKAVETKSTPCCLLPSALADETRRPIVAHRCGCYP